MKRPHRHRPRPSPSPVRDHIRAMSDADLMALVTELAVDAALKQSMLATARREINRRGKAAKLGPRAASPREETST